MITREKLYALVWKIPGTEAATQVGVSDVYLAHICRALGVPRPPRGYWRKLTRGYAVPVPALPPAGPATRLTWEPGDALGFVRRRRSSVWTYSTSVAEEWNMSSDEPRGGVSFCSPKSEFLCIYLPYQPVTLTEAMQDINRVVYLFEGMRFIQNKTEADL
jgi:hypothetical protein